MRRGTRPMLLALLGSALAGCWGRSAPPPPPPPKAPAPPVAPAGEPAPQPPPRPPHPLDQRVSFAFHAVPLPKVLARIVRETGVSVAVSPTVPLEAWQDHRVTLRMDGVPLRAVLDWLVRPLRAEYAIEADGAAWITRGDDLLRTEPVETHSVRVPTHLRSRQVRPGAFDYRQEQKQVVDTLETCLGYLLQRRRDCRLGFHGSFDVLVATLPPRGHTRLRQVLDAMRHGTERPDPPRPSRAELLAALDRPVACRGEAGPAGAVLLALAERAGVNLGCDGTRLGPARVTLPRSERPLRQALALVARQTALGRAEPEPGHGIWLRLEGQRRPFPSCGAVPWDRATVRAYDVRPLLRRRSPAAIEALIRQRLDPGTWERGLPAASVFPPTGRLIVVHDADGHRHLAALLGTLRARPAPAPKAEPKDTRP